LPRLHLPRRHLHRKTFAQKDICTERQLPSSHLLRRTFAEKDNYPERHLPWETCAQKDNCPYKIWLESNLLRNTIAHSTIDQKYVSPYKNALVRGLLRSWFCVQIIKRFCVRSPAKGGLLLSYGLLFVFNVFTNGCNECVIEI
jgi:hypothetical protein